MEIALQREAPPLRWDSSGALRVGESRVLLELVIHAFEDGATPETIAQQYPTATLADIYSVITYYLRHRSEVEAYLAEREKQSEKVRQQIESRQGIWQISAAGCWRVSKLPPLDRCCACWLTRTLTAISYAAHCGVVLVWTWCGFRM